MAKLPERGLTDQLPANVQAMMADLQKQHQGRANERVLRLAVMGGISVMPGGEKLGGGDIILADGAHREFTVHEPQVLRFENFVDTLAAKATQRNTKEVYLQFNHSAMDRRLMNDWMLMLQAEVRAGRRNALRGIHIRIFSRLGDDLYDGRLH
jgi:hypothetical protein